MADFAPLALQSVPLAQQIVVQGSSEHHLKCVAELREWAALRFNKHATPAPECSNSSWPVARPGRGTVASQMAVASEKLTRSPCSAECSITSLPYGASHRSVKAPSK